MGRNGWLGRGIWGIGMGIPGEAAGWLADGAGETRRRLNAMMTAVFPRWIGCLTLWVAGALLGVPAVAAKDPDGVYKVTRISGATYVEGERFGFPPQPILAGAVGLRMVVEEGRILRNERARGEISRMIVGNPRLLDQVVSFRVWQLPRFGKFKEGADGVRRARTVAPLIIEISLKHDDALSTVTAWAEYEAVIRGREMVLRVSFYGRGGYYEGEMEDYTMRGGARIVARRKAGER